MNRETKNIPTDEIVQSAVARPVGLLLPAAVGIACLISYWRTLCPTIYWGDGIELTAVAHVLGTPHPTGYPLFTLLAKLFQQLPIGT
ncbi:MAG: DUF2723 domain-containing protein, partial [bacterium]